MHNRLGHVVFVLIIASILNLAIAWLCTYYAVPGYQEAVVITADEFEKGIDIIDERDHDLAVVRWTALGLLEEDCQGPWYELWPKISREDFSVADMAQKYDSIIDVFVPNHDPLVLNDLRRQLLEIIQKIHTRIDAGWPLHSFRGFVSGGLQGPYNPPPVIPKRLPQEELTVIAIERSVSDTTMQRYLPYTPIWFGLIVNTLVYATVIIAIMWMLFTVRAKMRLRRKLCPNCKYPIGVSEVCTECGCALPVE